jgi:hypothetical protein
MSISSPSFNQSHDVMQAFLQQKAEKSSEQQQMQIIASTRHEEREQSYHKERVGQNLDAKA